MLYYVLNHIVVLRYLSLCNVQSIPGEHTRKQKIWKAILLRRRALEKSGVAHIP